MNFVEELKSILETDPLGLLAVKPKRSGVISADQRLVSSFDEINGFMRKHGREPEASRDINERKLYSRLKGLREQPEKAAALKEYDEFNMLGDIEVCEPEPIETIDDVLGGDPLGLLGEEPDIFTLKNVPKKQEMPDHIAKRKKCEEFEKFEPMFKQIHADLASGKKITKPFTSERQISPGEFFILQGMVVYVANIGKWEKKNFGNVNARLYCVFENGTESNMLLRSLAAAFWKDDTSRQIIDASQGEIFGETAKISEEDEATGYIYVLRSLSDDPKIKSIENLYKIGFSRVPVDQRIKNAKQEPTYLMADVRPVTQFQTYNLNPQKLELLLHTFFAEACLNIDVFDGEGKRYTPREWFVVPLHAIEVAIEMLISGEIVNYRYDSQREEIVEK